MENVQQSFWWFNLDKFDFYLLFASHNSKSAFKIIKNKLTFEMFDYRQEKKSETSLKKKKLHIAY